MECVGTPQARCQNERVPILTSELRTRSGYLVLKSTYSEPITVSDAEKFLKLCADGATYRHAGHLVVGKLTAVSGEARRVLESQAADPTNPPPVALVMSSAIMRMVASLAMRAGRNDNGEFFPDEQHALDWLDERMKVYETRRTKR
jgi:hypothetical protein